MERIPYTIFGALCEHLLGPNKQKQHRKCMREQIEIVVGQRPRSFSPHLGSGASRSGNDEPGRAHQVQQSHSRSRHTQCEQIITTEIINIELEPKCELFITTITYTKHISLIRLSIIPNFG